MAFSPVCIGSLTDFLGIIPGALTSTLFLLIPFLRFSLPSIGLPRASTTLPSNSLPTGTSTIEPVRFTVSPSLIALSSPKITIPTLSLSKFNAIPFEPSLNSTISPACTLSKPCTLAIPSPTDRTLPISETSVFSPKPLICSLSILVISEGFISMLSLNH